MAIAMPRSSGKDGAVICIVTRDQAGKLAVAPDGNRAFFFFGRRSQDPTNRSFADFSDDWFTEIVVGPDSDVASDALLTAMQAKHWDLAPDLLLSRDYSCTEHSRQVRLIPGPAAGSALFRVLIVDEEEPRPPATRLVHELWVYPDDMDIDLNKLASDVPETIVNKKIISAKRLQDGIRQTFPKSAL